VLASITSLAQSEQITMLLKSAGGDAAIVRHKKNARVSAENNTQDNRGFI
jgi:hypothetical protein